MADSIIRSLLLLLPPVHSSQPFLPTNMQLAAMLCPAPGSFVASRICLLHVATMHMHQPMQERTGLGVWEAEYPWPALHTLCSGSPCQLLVVLLVHCG